MAQCRDELIYITLYFKVKIISRRGGSLMVNILFSPKSCQPESIKWIRNSFKNRCIGVLCKKCLKVKGGKKAKPSMENFFICVWWLSYLASHGRWYWEFQTAWCFRGKNKIYCTNQGFWVTLQLINLPYNISLTDQRGSILKYSIFNALRVCQRVGWKLPFSYLLEYSSALVM